MGNNKIYNKKTKPDAQKKDQQDNCHLADIRKNVRTQQQQHDKQSHHGNHNCNQRSPVGRKIIVIIMEQSELTKHLHLTVSYAVSFAYNILSHQINDRFNRFHCFVSCLISGFLVYDHIRLDACAQNRGQNILCQGNINLKSDNLNNGLNGLIDLAFTN